jgi:DNA mismatch endonuclease (patch repair protein)
MHPPSPATIPTRDTAPELALRSALHKRGLRFHVDKELIPGTTRRADIVLRPSGTVVFVDGCFWHGCPLHHEPPRRNARFWRAKIEQIQEHDADTDTRLRALGWRVVHVWEHEDPAVAADAIRAMVAPWEFVASVTAGVVVGVALNNRFPEGVDLPLVGRAPASVPLAGGAIVGAIVARKLGRHRMARAAAGVAVGAGLVSVRGRSS